MFLIYCLLLFFVGFIFIKLFSFQKLYPEYLLFFLPLGFGTTSLVLFLSTLIWDNFFWGYIFIFAAACVGLYLFVRSIKRINFFPFKKYKLVYFILLSIIFVLFFFQPFLKLPFVAWDSWGLWGLKAKICYLENKIPFQFFYNQRFLSFLPHLSYPFNLVLNEVFFSALYGNFDESKLKLISILFGLISGFFIYFYLQRYLKCYKSFLLTFIFIFTPIFILHTVDYYSGCSDIIFLCYNMGAIASLLEFYIRKDRAYLYFSSLLSGFAFWTKIEGIIVLGACLCTIASFTKGRGKIRVMLMYVLFPLLINISWLIKLSSLHIWKGEYTPVFSQLSLRILMVLKAFLKEVIMIDKWNVLWIFLFILILLSGFRREKDMPYSFLVMVLSIEILSYLVILIFHSNLFNFLRFYPSLPLDRLMLHTLGLVIIIFGFNLREKDEIIHNYSCL
jgi:hypothetical protein